MLVTFQITDSSCIVQAIDSSTHEKLGVSRWSL